MYKIAVRPLTIHEVYLNTLGLEEHESIVAVHYWREYEQQAKEEGRWDND